MNKLKKIGLTALAGSLVATSVFAGEMAVTGSAAITFAGQDNTSSGNGFTMSDEIKFDGSGEMDNGWTVSVNMQLDNNAQDVAGNNMDNRSIKIDMGDAGTLSMVGHGGDSAMSAVDDVMPHADGNETWDTIAAAEGGATKLKSISGNSVNNMFSYTNSSMMDGLSVTATVSPSDGTNASTTNSYAVAYTGYDGLTVGYGIDENSEAGALQTDMTTMYVKYVYGPVTVGYQDSGEDSATAADNDDFNAYGISYAVNDSLTISYNQSEYNDSGVATNDQENTAFAVSYTMGSMSFVGTMVSMDNVGGSTAANDDVSGYEVGVTFAF